MNLSLKQEPVYIRFVIEPKAHAEGFRPDLKRAAVELAKYLLENGFIAFHGPTMNHDCDRYDYSATVYCYKPQRGLP